MVRTRGETAELKHLDQLPEAKTETEEDAFWETHSLGDDLLEQMEPFPDDFPLPPRPEMRAPAGAAQTLPIGKIMLGVVGLGLFAVGGYLAYRALKSGSDPSSFLPTKAPNLRMFKALKEVVAVRA